jgi:hypothetical protein
MVEWLKVMTLSSNPSSEKKRKEKPRSSFSHTQWCIPVMPATWETEVGRPQSTGLGKNVYVFQTLFAKQTKKDWKKGCTYLKWWRACLSLTPSTLTPPTSQNCFPRPSPAFLFYFDFVCLFFSVSSHLISICGTQSCIWAVAPGPLCCRLQTPSTEASSRGDFTFHPNRWGFSSLDPLPRPFSWALFQPATIHRS